MLFPKKENQNASDPMFFAGGKTVKNVQQLWKPFPKVRRNAGATARVAFCHLLPNVGFPKKLGTLAHAMIARVTILTRVLA